MRYVTAIALALTATVALAAEKEISVPSDPSAQYFVIERGGTASKPTLTTKRIGRSGTSYSKRAFDCSAGTGKYIGDGDTLQEMQKPMPNSKMAPAVEGSIAWTMLNYACSR